MSNTSPPAQQPNLLVPPIMTSAVLHEPPHWHHHTMTPVISATSVVPPHISHHDHHHTADRSQSTLPYTIRPGTLADLKAIHKIYTYYVLNSALSFLVHPPDISYIEKGYEASATRRLPYLVAVSTHARTTLIDTGKGPVSSDDKTEISAAASKLDQNTVSQVSEAVEIVLGYAHVVPVSEKAGYGCSVELTMYLHPSYLSFGIGSALMSALETSLRQDPITVFEQGFEDKSEERFADIILVRVSDDVEKDFEGVRMNDGREWPVWKAQGEKNRQWYLRKGFEEVGRMKRIGEKFGKRADVIILQKFLRSS